MPDQVSGVRESQQHQQRRHGDSQQLPGGAAQRPAEHGPLPEEAQLVGRLRERQLLTEISGRWSQTKGNQTEMSHLEHQNEEQHRRHDRVRLRLPAHSGEVSERISLLHVRRPLLAGRGAAAQLQPAHGRRQGEFTDAQKSPGGQQVPAALSDEAHDPSHQEVQDQHQESHLEDRKPEGFIRDKHLDQQRPCEQGAGDTIRRSCRSRPLIGHRVKTRRSRVDWARSDTGNSNRKEKTARRFVLIL